MSCCSVPATGTTVPAAKLTSGLNRLKAEKRLEELVEIRQTAAAHPLPGRELAASQQDLWHGLGLEAGQGL